MFLLTYLIPSSISIPPENMRKLLMFSGDIEMEHPMAERLHAYEVALSKLYAWKLPYLKRNGV